MSIIEKLKATTHTDLKKKWAGINEIMLTHLEGECPLYIFRQRRPLEAKSEYAIDYRTNNFHPVTKSPFDKAISAVSEISASANLSINNRLENTKKEQITVCYQDEDIELFEWCLNRLTRIRELDSNGFIVDYSKPLIESKYDANLDSFDTQLETIWIPSEDVVSLKNDVLIANIGKWEWKDKFFEPYRLIISKEQTALSIPKANGTSFEYVDYPIYENRLTHCPFIKVSKNQYVNKKLKYALPYFWGAAAWGNKFYGEMTDFDIKMTRFTYPHTIKAKLDCNEPGKEWRNNKHCDVISGLPCTACKGTGSIYPEESPLGAIYVDWSKYNTENGNVPIISHVEPSQGGIQTSEKILDKYYDLMSIELGLMKQNMSDQSGESKSYDEKTRISMYTNIVMDNIRVLEAILNVRQDYLYNPTMTDIAVISIEVIGELNIKTNEELIAELVTANAAHPAIKVALTKKILLKQLGDNETNRRVIDIASSYDKLFMYGANDLVSARAQLGSIKEKDVIIHNTVIDQILKMIKTVKEDDKIIEKLDSYYKKFDSIPQTTPVLV